MHLQGWDAERRGGVGDRGADVVLRRAGALAAVAQCKSRQVRNLRDEEVEQFARQLDDMRFYPDLAGVERGYLVTNQTLTQGARRAAERAGLAERPMEVRDHTWLVETATRHAPALRAHVAVCALLEHQPSGGARQRLPWSQAEEEALRTTFLSMQDCVNARGARPWKEILRQVHLNHPGVLDARREGGSLKDKARSMGLV